MTNAEKYKTAKECYEEFRKWCLFVQRTHGKCEVSDNIQCFLSWLKSKALDGKDGDRV